MDLKPSDFFNLNIKKQSNQENTEIKEDEDIKESENKRKRSLDYDEEEYSILGATYGLSKHLEDKPRRGDGCIKKDNFENMYQKIPTIITKALLETVFVYLEEGRKCSYFDSYQENVGIEEKSDVISETLIYSQIQRLIFRNANSYSYKRVPPLEYYFKKGQDSVMYKILQSYFLAIYDVFGITFLYSSDAFRLMIEIFPIFYDIGTSKKDLRYEFFKEEFEFVSRHTKYTERDFVENKIMILDKIYDTVVW